MDNWNSRYKKTATLRGIFPHGVGNIRDHVQAKGFHDFQVGHTGGDYTVGENWDYKSGEYIPGDRYTSERFDGGPLRNEITPEARTVSILHEMASSKHQDAIEALYATPKGEPHSPEALELSRHAHNFTDDMREARDRIYDEENHK